MEENRLNFVAFTDGSCDNKREPHCGGWAFIVFNGNCNHPEIEEADMIRSGSFRNTTNNLMELTAIVQVVRLIPEHSNVIIVTDSQYCITVLDHKTKIFPKNMNVISAFRKFTKERDIRYKFHWIKGHSGNKYNEFVDKLALSEYMKEDGFVVDLEGFV
ncbi:MAG: hypothetical protein MJZ30_11620 [Paludibacteraceae bacterium]|nr:hypothetical protein [Paludibacteraceae bacterium]